MKKHSELLYTTALVIMFGVCAIGQSYQMVQVTGGTFEMGATPEQNGVNYPKEEPAHTVEVPDFWIGVYEVNQTEWSGIMGDNPSLNINSGNKNPVDYLDWMSAVVFCNEYTKADPSLGLAQCVYYKDASFTNPFGITDYQGDGNTEQQDVYIDYSRSGYRLPTEAEWEYAARGGALALATRYAGSDDLGAVAIYTDNSDWESYPVGSREPNELGLYDMSGNVWEMVNDWYGTYSSIPAVHPKGPAIGTHKVLRGGAYDYRPRMCRVSSRYMVLPNDKDSDIGFRMARNK